MPPSARPGRCRAGCDSYPCTRSIIRWSCGGTSPGLAPQLNAFLQNCDRSVSSWKLGDTTEPFDIASTNTSPGNTYCGYLDERSRHKWSPNIGNSPPSLPPSWNSMTGVVREGGLEPPCLAARDFESRASTVPPLSRFPRLACTSHQPKSISSSFFPAFPARSRPRPR